MVQKHSGMDRNCPYGRVMPYTIQYSFRCGSIRIFAIARICGTRLGHKRASLLPERTGACDNRHGNALGIDGFKRFYFGALMPESHRHTFESCGQCTPGLRLRPRPTPRADYGIDGS
jgi:hypothetical protein